MYKKQTDSQNMRFVKNEVFTTWEIKDRLEYLCLLGHLAPSSHNTQPWRFFISTADSTITIYLNRKFILPASDIEGRQATISIGCAIENIETGARYYGYQIEVRYLCDDKTKAKPIAAKGSELTEMVNIKCTEAAPELNLESNVQAIFDRKVTRAEYDPTKPIPSYTIDLIQKLAGEGAAKLDIITDSAKRLTVAEFQSQADAYVINSPKFSRELGDWLLPNNSTSFLGMTGITFGLQDDEALRLHNGLSGKSALQPEDGLKFATGGKILIEKSPLIGIITTREDSIKNWIIAGRVFEKIFLELTKQNIQLAVHAGITEVPLIKKIFSMTMETDRFVTVLFRAGYVKKQEDAHRPHSPRLPLQEVILTNKP